MALTVFFTEFIKRKMSKTKADDEANNFEKVQQNAKFWAPFCALVFGTFLNLIFVLIFEVTDYYAFWVTFEWRQALKDGLDIGMKAGGLYGIGKVVTKKIAGSETYNNLRDKF
ncbi:MAG: hypothetical protein FH758_12580 [Firmicutes bacterium]|nr:hypothetical protein [Bacillota bacterium]